MRLESSIVVAVLLLVVGTLLWLRWSGRTGRTGLNTTTVTPAQPVPAWRGEWVPTGRFRVWVRRFGNPAHVPVVMIHGFRRSGWTFLPLLADLSEQYHLIVLDLPGHGETAAEVPEAAPTFETFVEAVEVVRAQLGIARWTLLGHSMGGTVAGLYAARHPERCAGVILLESTPRYRGWAKTTECQDCPALVTDEGIAVLNDAVHGAQSYRDIWEEYEAADATALFADRSLPVLWVMNTDDRITRAHFERLAAGLSPDVMSHVRLETVYRKGHFIHWTATHQVRDMIGGFLRDVAR